MQSGTGSYFASIWLDQREQFQGILKCGDNTLCRSCFTAHIAWLPWSEHGELLKQVGMKKYHLMTVLELKLTEQQQHFYLHENDIKTFM